MTVDFRFGADEDDRVRMLNHRRVPMVDSVFANRDRILRSFVQLMIQGGMKSPSVVRELVPLARYMRPRK